MLAKLSSFQRALDEVDDEYEQDEERIGGNAAHCLRDLAVDGGGIVHDLREAGVTENDDECACGEQLRRRDQYARKQNAANGLHGGELIVPDGDEDKERPDEDGVEAEINEPDVVGRTHGEGDRREDARRQPIFAGVNALAVDHEKADCASCGLRNVAEQNVEENEL